MKEIICPECGDSTPDDSFYCEMCGTELLVCVQCGSISTGNFCGDCGGATVSRKHSASTIPNRRPSTTSAGNRSQEREDDDDGHHTGRGGAPKLRLRGGNLVIVPKDGAVIGRKEGEYTAQLAGFDLISRRHGKFVKRGRNWYLVDFDSTNGCLINDVELEPHVPMVFRKGDVVDIGTYEFDVL